MKNISDLVLLMVIAVVFLQKKTDSKGNMQHIWIWGVSKTRVAMLCFGYGSHEIHPQQQVGRLRGWAVGRVGYGRCPMSRSTAELGAGVMGSSQAQLGSPCSRHDRTLPASLGKLRRSAQAGETTAHWEAPGEAFQRTIPKLGQKEDKKPELDQSMECSSK